MSDKTENTEDTENSPNSPEKPYFGVEFDKFLEAIGEAQIDNWSAIAEALGVDRKTIYLWRKHPLAQKAISTGISRALDKMEKSGESDWRMWRERAKILGVKDRQTLEHEVGEGVTELLDEMERTDYDKVGQQAKKQVVADNAPVQDKE